MYDAVEKVSSERSIAQNRSKASKNRSKILQEQVLDHTHNPNREPPRPRFTTLLTDGNVEGVESIQCDFRAHIGRIEGLTVQVLLDTNVFFSDLRLQKSELRLLLERSRSGYIRLLVPEVVIRETVNKFREQLSDIERRRNSIERELDELLSVMESARVEELDVATQVRAYERDLRQQLAAANADVLEIPRVPHDELIGRAIAKRKPFGEKDRGYRDALIWFNVLDGARSDRVAFISNNHKDFAGSDENLAPVLQEEVDELGYGEDRVTLYPGLRAFRREYLESAPDDKRLLEELLRDDVALREEVDEELQLIIFGEIEARQQLSLTKAHEERVEVVRGTVDSIQIVDAYEATDESVVVDLKAVCSVDLQFYVLKDEAYLLDREDRRIISNWDADEHYALGEATFDELEVELTGVFNRLERGLYDLDVASIS